MKPVRPLPAAALLLALTGGGAAQAAEKVVTSIKPVHSLVAAVMEGVGEPALLLEGASSPHSYSMRPSQARQLQEADLVFWVGPGLEAFLAKPLETLTGDATRVALAESEGLTLLEMRAGGAFEAHSHGDHGDHEAHGADEHAHEAHEEEEHAHAAHDGEEEHAHEANGEEEHAHEAHGDGEHGHEAHGEAAHADHAETTHDAAGHEDHAHGADAGEHHHDGHNMHIWLDPRNAKAMVTAIAEALSRADPDNASTYAANARTQHDRIDALEAEIAAELAPVAGRPFIVFHDAYQYFENRFGLAAAGSITVSPEAIPGAGRVEEIHGKIAELDAACVFAEPQFEPRLVDVVTEGTDARSGVLDPLGAEIADGPDLYFQLMRGMATALKECLAAQG